MLFFTRELYDGSQDDSGWARAARSKVERNCKLYKRYFRFIRPYLPPSAGRFDELSFHDAQVVSHDWHDQKLSMVLDTSGTFFVYRSRYAHITFTGIRSRPAGLPRKKDWWIWDEFHLGSRTKFVLHVMFTETEIEIPADEIK